MDGTIVTPSVPTSTEVKTDDGVWVFKGWDRERTTIAGANVEFIGKWTFSLNAVPINSIPVIQATDKVLTVGDTFDPLADVTAYDQEDGVITLKKENIIKNEVDTTKAGTYIVTYKVTDQQGASCIKSITVTVKETAEVPQKPDQQDKTSTPDTGDRTNAVGLLCGLFISLGVFIGFGYRKFAKKS